jgi:hypothetical protein
VIGRSAGLWDYFQLAWIVASLETATDEATRNLQPSDV